MGADGSETAGNPGAVEGAGGEVFARLDFGRGKRTGFPEAVYGAGKTGEQLAAILGAFRARGVPALATRCTAEQAAAVRAAGLEVRFDGVSGLLTGEWGERRRLEGVVAVCTGGTADLAVAEEAAGTVEFHGAEVRRHYDVGVAGLERLLGRIGEIREADAVIVAAGMEGALASVVTGLVAAPVVAVPTSRGYGASFGGLAALLGMLNGCAEGMATVNIDNGFGAGMMAVRLLRGMEKGRRR